MKRKRPFPVLQRPSDTIPFHFTGGAGQAWPSVDACDVGEPVAQTDTQPRAGARGSCWWSWARSFIPLIQSTLTAPPTAAPCNLPVALRGFLSPHRFPFTWALLFQHTLETCLHSCSPKWAGKGVARKVPPLAFDGTFPKCQPCRQ